MFFSIWLGIILSGGQTGCTPFQHQAAAPAISTAPMQVQRRGSAAPSAGPSVPARGLHNLDSPMVPKVPPPGAKVVYNSIHISEPYIALTFDDGPHISNTPRLLDMLRERNIKATFFVVGKCAQEYPHLVRRILAEGHEIGNHTWTHRSLPTLSEASARDELAKTAKAVEDASGYHMRIMRPPYGATSLRVKKMCYDDFGYPTILWDVDPFDWKRPGASIVRNRILGGTHPGSIILCHDIHQQTIDAMPDTLDTLLSKGYRFVTVSQLLNLDAAGAAQAANTVPQAAVPAVEPAASAGL